MLARFDPLRLSRGLLSAAAFTAIPALFGFKYSVPIASALLALAVVATVTALVIANSKPHGRSFMDVLDPRPSRMSETPIFKSTLGGTIGGNLFAGFVAAVAVYAAADEGWLPTGAPLLLAASILFFLVVLIWARRPVAPARPASASDLRVGLTLGHTSSGAAVAEGDELMDRLMRQTAPCQRCGAEIQFEQGGSLAVDKGIRDKVVVCASCDSIYEVGIGPSGMRLTADVTSKYTGKRRPLP